MKHTESRVLKAVDVLIRAREKFVVNPAYRNYKALEDAHRKLAEAYKVLKGAKNDTRGSKSLEKAGGIRRGKKGVLHGGKPPRLAGVENR